MANSDGPTLSPSASVAIQMVGLAGVVASFLALPDDKIGPAVLSLIGLLALSMAWMSARWRYFTAPVLAVALLSWATLTWLGILPPKPQPDDASIVQPALNEAVPFCSRIDVQVIGKQPPAGWSYAVAQRDQNDDRYYFEPLRRQGQAWTAEISTFTTPLHLWVVAIHDQWTRYLATTTDEASATYWSSPDWPPESVRVYDAPVAIAGRPPAECPAG